MNVLICPVCPMELSDDDYLPHIIRNHKSYYNCSSNSQYQCKMCEYTNNNNVKLYNRKSYIAHLKYKHNFSKTIFDAKKKIRDNLQQEHVMRMEIDPIENNVPDDWYEEEDIVLDDTNVFEQKLLKLMCLYAVENIYTEKSLSAFNDFTKKLVNLVSEQFEDYEDTIDTRAILSTVAFNLDIVKKTDPESYYETTEVPFFNKNIQNTSDSEEESELGTSKLIHVNVKKDLELFLNHEKIQKHLEFDFPDDRNLSTVRTKFTDGTWFKERIFNGEKVIILILYFDDVSINDVRSGHYLNNKITNFSYSVCNLSGMKSSSVHNIRFMGLTISDGGKSDSFNSLIKLFLNKFANLKVNINGELIKTVVGSIVCDNLANNAIHNLPKSFNPNVVGNCRGCILDSSTWQSLEIFKNFVPESQLRTISNNPVLRDICTTFDPFHDANEGFIQPINTLFFHILITKGNISYLKLEKLLQHLTKQLKYGQKLSDVVRSNMLKNFRRESYPRRFTMNGVEQAQLLKMLPIIFYIVEKKNYNESTLNDNIVREMLNLVILTNDILDYLNAKEQSSRSDIVYKENVGKWAECYKKVDPQKRFTIKEHNLVHYIEMSVKTGITSINSTMRFEAGNKIVKNSILNSCNKMNVALTGIRNIIRRNLMLSMTKYSLLDRKYLYKLKTNDYVMLTNLTSAKILSKIGQTKYSCCKLITQKKNGCVIIKNEGELFEVNENEIKDKYNIIEESQNKFLLSVMHHCII